MFFSFSYLKFKMLDFTKKPRDEKLKNVTVNTEETTIVTILLYLNTSDTQSDTTIIVVTVIVYF